MDRHIERFLNRVSLIVAALATLSLLHLYTRPTLYCTELPPPLHNHLHRNSSAAGDLQSFSYHHHHYGGPHHHPNTSCDVLYRRDHLPTEKRHKKLLSSASFKKRVRSLSSLFGTLRTLDLLSNSSRVLSVFAGAGHEVVALKASGVVDVTAVDVVDFPPLVSRADPHNLPFFDGVFDLAFTAGIGGSLFPARFAKEMERTVRRGGAEAVVVDRDWEAVEEIKKLFRRSSAVDVRNVTLGSDDMVMIVFLRNNGKGKAYS